ncbi:hypothetical protein [Sporolituus thermophilus]|uniref:Uncharacterized protein n=1 Tax=Sporolituus thermophilus DSM 23256 TaxID=1123285 RepID=A0A1G7P8V1_9FIRM|nr:hypothetical protein [Sporolituus thermophilus]SDF82722.1 hypothetical protein SAMN05660235_02878 [Sporolituus thermophilus DSM 23256]
MRKEVVYIDKKRRIWNMVDRDQLGYDAVYDSEPNGTPHEGPRIRNQALNVNTDDANM